MLEYQLPWKARRSGVGSTRRNRQNPVEWFEKVVPTMIEEALPMTPERQNIEDQVIGPVRPGEAHILYCMDQSCLKPINESLIEGVKKNEQEQLVEWLEIYDSLPTGKDYADGKTWYVWRPRNVYKEAGPGREWIMTKKMQLTQCCCLEIQRLARDDNNFKKQKIDWKWLADQEQEPKRVEQLQGQLKLEQFEKTIAVLKPESDVPLPAVVSQNKGKKWMALSCKGVFPMPSSWAQSAEILMATIERQATIKQTTGETKVKCNVGYSMEAVDNTNHPTTNPKGILMIRTKGEILSYWAMVGLKNKMLAGPGKTSRYQDFHELFRRRVLGFQHDHALLLYWRDQDKESYYYPCLCYREADLVPYSTDFPKTFMRPFLPPTWDELEHSMLHIPHKEIVHEKYSRNVADVVFLTANQWVDWLGFLLNISQSEENQMALSNEWHTFCEQAVLETNPERTRWLKNKVERFRIIVGGLESLNNKEPKTAGDEYMVQQRKRLYTWMRAFMNKVEAFMNEVEEPELPFWPHEDYLYNRIQAPRLRGLTPAPAPVQLRLPHIYTAGQRGFQTVISTAPGRGAQPVEILVH
jgi:hypothetical protein